MSSRILRGKPIDETPSIALRFVQGVAKNCEAIVDGSQQQNSGQSEADWEAKVRAAFEQGLREGRLAADGLAAGRAQELVKPAVDGFRILVDELSRTKSRLRGEAEEDVLKLSLAISKRVLHRELATDPEALLGLIRAAWDRVDGRETQRLRLSPDDAAIVQQYRNALNLPPRVEVVSDPELARGSAFFDTSRGSLDASIATQLGEIERGLTDVLKRHKAGV